MTFLPASLLVLASAALPRPAQELDARTLSKVKAATVFVVNERVGRGTGSGYLFLRRGSGGYVITCEHVVRGAETVGIVFHSGTAKERALTGQVIAVDDDRDLACVLLKDANNLPDPLSVDGKTSVRETETLYVAGFPFGRILAAGAKNPEISVSKVSVSSIRRDTDDRVTSVQLSGDVNPGNSGGPAVDSKGQVVGVARSKILGSSTAFAIPPEEIRGFLKGRVRSSSFTPTASTKTRVTFRVKIGLIDPLGELKRVGIAWIRRSQLTGEPKAGAGGEWDRIPRSRTVSLKIDEGEAEGTLTVSRVSSDGDRATLLVQVYFAGSGGPTLWTQPAPLEVDFGGGAVAGSGGGGGVTPVPVPAVKGKDLAVADQPSVLATLPLRAAVADLFLSPDGKSLYALDLSEGAVYRIDPETLEVKAQVEAAENAVTMCLTPDGDTLYVGGRDPDPRKPSGRIQSISTSSMKAGSTFEVAFAVHDVEATDRGTIAATGLGQWGGFAVIDARRRSISSNVHRIYGGSVLRLHPDQARAYTGDMGLSPADYHCVDLRKSGPQGHNTYDSPYHGDYPLGGNFEITPDGRYLIGCTGSVLRLAKAQSADLRYAGKIDRGIAIGVAKGSNTFVVATQEGFLKIYDLAKLELKKSVKIGLACTRVVLDPGRNRIYAVGGPVTAGGRYSPRELRVGDIVSLSLSGK